MYIYHRIIWVLKNSQVAEKSMRVVTGKCGQIYLSEIN